MSSTLKTLALPTLLLALATGCLDGADRGPDGAFLFGLTADQVLSAKRVAHTELTDAAWLDAHRGEFDCARYGTLCRDVGRDAAYQVIEIGYLMAIDGADRDAIRAAQADALAEAEAAAPADAPELFATATSFYYGGSTSHRLKVVARAVEMWPSLELRASGECVTQRNAFGWLPAASDRVAGTMTATWTGLPVEVVASTVANYHTVTFGPRQHDANHLTVLVSCNATEEGWTAAGTATQTL